MDSTSPCSLGFLEELVDDEEDEDGDDEEVEDEDEEVEDEEERVCFAL